MKSNIFQKLEFQKLEIEVAVGEVNEFGEHSRESSRINDRLNSVQLQIG